MQNDSAGPGKDTSPIERRLATILMADVYGYSKKMGEDEERTVRNAADQAARREHFQEHRTAVAIGEGCTDAGRGEQAQGGGRARRGRSRVASLLAGLACLSAWRAVRAVGQSRKPAFAREGYAGRGWHGQAGARRLYEQRQGDGGRSDGHRRRQQVDGIGQLEQRHTGQRNVVAWAIARVAQR